MATHVNTAGNTGRARRTPVRRARLSRTVGQTTRGPLQLDRTLVTGTCEVHAELREVSETNRSTERGRVVRARKIRRTGVAGCPMSTRRNGRRGRK